MAQYSFLNGCWSGFIISGSCDSKEIRAFISTSYRALYSHSSMLRVTNLSWILRSLRWCQVKFKKKTESVWIWLKNINFIGFVAWAIRQLDYFADLFRRQVFSAEIDNFTMMGICFNIANAHCKTVRTINIPYTILCIILMIL